MLKPALFTLSILSLFFTLVADASGQLIRKQIPDKVIVLTFDDAVLSHATIAAPLLKKYGFGATFYIAEFAKPPFSDKTLYMTWEQIRMLNQMGFEIGNHTGHHIHVPGMDPEQFTEELEYIEAMGVDRGIPKPLTFAYPAYQTAAYAVDVLRQKDYIFARIGDDRAYDPQKDHPYLIPSYTMLGDNRDLIYDAFEQARDGKIVVLTIHGVPDTAHPWVNTPQELFEEYLQYLSDNNFTVLSLRDLAQYVDARKAMREITPVFK